MYKHYMFVCCFLIVFNLFVLLVHLVLFDLPSIAVVVVVLPLPSSTPLEEQDGDKRDGNPCDHCTEIKDQRPPGLLQLRKLCLC